MSMLETDVNMGASDDIEDLDWHTDFWRAHWLKTPQCRVFFWFVSFFQVPIRLVFELSILWPTELAPLHNRTWLTCTAERVDWNLNASNLPVCLSGWCPTGEELQPVEMWCFPQGHFRLLAGAEGRNVHGCNVPTRCVTEASRTYPTCTTSPLTPKSRLKFWYPVNSKFVEKSSCCLFSYLMVGPVCTERDLKMFFLKNVHPFPHASPTSP